MVAMVLFFLKPFFFKNYHEAQVMVTETAPMMKRLKTAVALGVRKIDYTPDSLNQEPTRYYLMWLMLPAIVLLAAISLYPFFWLIYMIFHAVQLAPGKPDVWVGISNFTRLFSDSNFISGWLTLFKYSAFCLSIELVLGVLTAVILNNSRFEKILVELVLAREV